MLANNRIELSTENTLTNNNNYIDIYIIVVLSFFDKFEKNFMKISLNFLQPLVTKKMLNTARMYRKT